MLKRRMLCDFLRFTALLALPQQTNLQRGSPFLKARRKTECSCILRIMGRSDSWRCQWATLSTPKTSWMPSATCGPTTCTRSLCSTWKLVSLGACLKACSRPTPTFTPRRLLILTNRRSGHTAAEIALSMERCVGVPASIIWVHVPRLKKPSSPCRFDRTCASIRLCSLRISMTGPVKTRHWPRRRLGLGFPVQIRKTTKSDRLFHSQHCTRACLSAACPLDCLRASRTSDDRFLLRRSVLRELA